MKYIYPLIVVELYNNASLSGLNSEWCRFIKQGYKHVLNPEWMKLL